MLIQSGNIEQIKNYQQWDFIIFLLLTLLSIINGQTTVFYLMYFFWWNELIRIIVDKFYAKKNPNDINKDWQSSDLKGELFLMGIYWVFLIVFFWFHSRIKQQRDNYNQYGNYSFSKLVFQYQFDFYIIRKDLFTQKTTTLNYLFWSI